MKKLISLLLALIMLLGVLTACGGSSASHPMSEQDPQAANHNPFPSPSPSFSIPEGLSGVDVIKLLLADERLGGKLIDNSENIFANGATTFRTLAARAQQNFNAPMVTVTEQEGEIPGMLSFDSDTGSTEITEFDELSRNFAEFESTTEVIVSNAKHAADMIDFVKKYIRILDTWVTNPHILGEELYLHVEENSETIFRRHSDNYTICHRYKNEQGDDVYELTNTSSIETIRFTYIAGKKYEMIHNMEEGQRYQGISANHDKGYWEIFDVIYDPNWIEYPFATSFIIMKDDICYRAGYSLREDSTVNYTVTSADRKVDLFLISENETTTMFDISLGAFDGYYGVVDLQPGNMGKLKLADGRIIGLDYTDFSFLNSPCVVGINGIYASESAFGQEGNLMITIMEGDSQTRRSLLLEILSAWGITCKYDMAQVFQSVDHAHSEFAVMRQYLKWNGHDVNTMEGLMAGVEVEKALFENLLSKYEAIKNAPVVQVDSEAAALLIQFPTIVEKVLGDASVTGLDIAIDSISLSVSDMLLFVKNEEYKIAFAMKSETGSLTHIEVETPAIAYDGADRLTVTAQDLTLRLPMLSPGEYTLVAYISTADGIRSSAPMEIGISTVSEAVTKEGNLQATVLAENGWLKVTYEETEDAIDVILRHEATSYETLYQLMAEIAFQYGIPSEDLIERFDPETKTATPLTGSEENIENGTYRIAYTVSNGETEQIGYLYVEYQLEEAAPVLEE